MHERPCTEEIVQAIQPALENHPQAIPESVRTQGTPLTRIPIGEFGLKKDEVEKFRVVAREAVEFAKFTLKLFEDVVLKNKAYLDLIVGDVYTHSTYYMGMVDKKNKVNFYDGDLRVVDPTGKEYLKFDGRQFRDHLKEAPQTWTYAKMLYLQAVGWKGFIDGKDSGIYRVAPLARLNVAEGMATPLAQAEYQKLFSTFGKKPVHHTLAYHWARLVEVMYAAERMMELADDPELLSPEIRTIPTATPTIGIGVCEAPRGTLIHQYETDANGVLTKVNLLVATQNNAAAINMSVTQAAKKLIQKSKVTDGILNMVEMAFRAYDPCFACTTHSLPGEMPLIAKIHAKDGTVIQELRRDA